MKNLVQNFPQQLKEAMQIGEQAKFTQPLVDIRNVIVTGLGGSGIGGTIVSEIMSNECSVPITVNKDYFLPSFVNAHTLVIVSSYSGNTEETIMAMETALHKKAKVVCVTSGGKIADMASANDLDCIIIPGGMPPRSCLGYSLTQLFYVLQGLRLIGHAWKPQLKAAIELIEKQEVAIKSEAMDVTDFLYKKMPVIYAVDGYNGVATRFRQQINENSKMLCWHHILPEMNHNELVGWAEPHQECAVVILRNSSDYARTQTRIEISKEIFAKYTSSIKEIWSKGESQIERSIYLIHLTDWVSCYLADKKQIDAVEVNVINHLKGSLAKI
ncbi:MAG: bifunctional phosphoglucose/phosphomannose isomerase [Bacteroidetes bacterium]|nr:bifunctional phosphoglucose/phosphomannose isomerase [Bacteroidota bacterium]